MKIMHHNSSPIDIYNDEEFIKKWRPSEGWLVADGDDFVLPIHHSTLTQPFYQSYCRRAKLEIIALLTFIVLMLSFQAIKPTPAFWLHFIVIGALVLFAIIDRKTSALTLKNCRQKVEFLFNVKLVAKKIIIAFIPLFASLLFLQSWLTHHYNGFDNFVMQVGNYYPKINFDSSWRFISGPFIHADTQHLIINATLTLLFASMIPQVTVRKAFFLLASGAFFSHFFTFVFAQLFNSSFDALLGISGGSFTLLAYACACYFRIKHTHTAISLFTIFIISELSLGLLSSNTSHTAHFSGFSFGVLACVLSPPFLAGNLTPKVPLSR